MNTNSFVRSRAFVTLALGVCQVTSIFSHEGAETSVAAPDSHAPIGVMGDHLHRTGEFMVSYRHMYMSMDGHRAGENRLSTQEVYARGFAAAATQMDMNMDMFGVMYAPNDRVTLMGMANYLDLEMEMEMNPHAGMSDHGMHGTAMSHETSGWGDLSVSALVKAFERDGFKAHWNIGLSAPTGSVSEMMHGTFQPYGMQLGSGTWDAKIGGTFSQNAEKGSWGGQLLLTHRLEDVGESGFSRSDALEASIWRTYRLSRSLSISGRLKYSAEGALKGHYIGAHSHSAPPHFQSNYGGELVDAILGINYIQNEGVLKGTRIALEVGTPLYQQLNGVGMNREVTTTLGCQFAW